MMLESEIQQLTLILIQNSVKFTQNRQKGDFFMIFSINKELLLQV